MKFNILLILSFMIAYPIFAEDAEVITVTGTRLPSGGGGGGGAAAAMSGGLHSSTPERCDEPNCGQDEEVIGGGLTPAQIAEELAATLANLLAKLKNIWSAFGRVKFDCHAMAVCQSPSVLGGKCEIRGLYLTADEAYNAFSHADCCSREGKGNQIGVDFKGCSTF